MAALLYYPAFGDKQTLINHLFRAVWHFIPMVEKLDRLIFLYSGSDIQEIDVDEVLASAERFIPEDFDPNIGHFASRFIGKISIEKEIGENISSKELEGVIVWNTAEPSFVAEAQSLAKAASAEAVLADPERIQQETLQTIRFAYSLWTDEELGQLVENSYAQFLSLNERIKGKAISAFGNGPSLKDVVAKKINVGETVRAVCNSTIGDLQALDLLQPELLFCGDPVQHCGVSLYAGQFRQDLARALEDSRRVVFTQLGYVPYFQAVTPTECHDRIIGVGNDRRPEFNIDLKSEYLTAATANIFTMLVLPVAFTLSKSLDIYGCDGMSFASATKPWSHSDETDYMSKMSVTHRVHRGFWQRNYEEEYWSYSRDLAEICDLAEANGHTIKVRTPSYVPALAKRYVSLSD